MNVSWRVSVRPLGAGWGNIHVWIYMLVLNISCQLLGDECKLENIYFDRTSARGTSARPHNYLFWWPDKCQEDKCQTSKLLEWNPRLVWWRGRDLTEDFSTRWAALSSGLVRGRGWDLTFPPGWEMKRRRRGMGGEGKRNQGGAKWRRQSDEETVFEILPPCALLFSQWFDLIFEGIH